MYYVILQASFWAMENDSMILLDLLINQEEDLDGNAKFRGKIKVVWLSSAFQKIKNRILIN